MISILQYVTRPVVVNHLRRTNMCGEACNRSGTAAKASDGVHHLLHFSSPWGAIGITGITMTRLAVGCWYHTPTCMVLLAELHATRFA